MCHVQPGALHGQEHKGMDKKQGVESQMMAMITHIRAVGSNKLIYSARAGPTGLDKDQSFKGGKPPGSMLMILTIGVNKKSETNAPNSIGNAHVRPNAY
jgi:hypothetical protein